MPKSSPQRKKSSGFLRRLLRGVIWVFFVLLLLWSASALGLKVWRWAALPEDAPVVGLSMDPSWYSQLGVTTAPYLTALNRVGADILPIRPGEISPEKALERIDALLLCGGGDVDPVIYGGDPDSAQLVSRARDDLELALIRGALERDMPILGICRGIQILNVAQGGTLRTIRSKPVLKKVHGITSRSLRAHDATVIAGSGLARIVGAGRKEVNSFHGQAVDRLGADLTAAAVAPDGVIEALERSDHRFVIGIQWHPEILSLEDSEELAIFEVFVRKAAAYRKARVGAASPSAP